MAGANCNTRTSGTPVPNRPWTVFRGCLVCGVVVSVSRTGSRRYRRNREAVLSVSDVCWICGRPGADTADHVVPHALGGSDAVDNLRPAHRSCNARRGIGSRDRLIEPRTSRVW